MQTEGSMLNVHQAARDGDPQRSGDRGHLDFMYTPKYIF